MLVRLGQRGTLTLPKELREGLAENVLFEAVRRGDGVIELRPQVTIDASQSWFWTQRWQRMEREADGDYASGRFKTYDDVESFLTGLEAGAEELAE